MKCGTHHRLFLIIPSISVFLVLVSCIEETPEGQDPQGPAGATQNESAHNPEEGQTRRFAAIPVQATDVQAGPLTADRQTSGVVNAVTESQIASTGSGVVAKVLRKPGDWVTAGEVVIQLDDTQAGLSLQTAEANHENAAISLATAQNNIDQAVPRLNLQLESAQSSLAAAQKNYDSTLALFQLGGTSGSELDNAKSQLQTAQANLESARIALDQNKNASTQNLAQLRIALNQAGIQVRQAQLNLSNTAVKAPFPGLISSIRVKQGEYLGQNSVAFVLVSAEKQIGFSVSPDDGAFLRAGSPVVFTYGNQAIPARVLQNAPPPTNGMVTLTAGADGLSSLPYGSVGAVSFQVTLATGTLIPVAAMQASGSRAIAYTVEDGLAVHKIITVKAQAGNTAAVEGIAGGSTVILNPPPGLVDGAEVRVVNPAAQVRQPSSASTSGESQPGGFRGQQSQAGGSPEVQAGRPTGGSQRGGTPQESESPANSAGARNPENQGRAQGVQR